MSEYHFMLACSVVVAALCFFVAGAYFKMEEYGRAIFSLLCALVNAGCGYYWLHRQNRRTDTKL